MAEAILPVKKCRKCGSEFSGVRCKACVKTRMAQYYKQNKARIDERVEAYRCANQEKVRESLAAWYKKNRDRALANSVAYRTKNKEKVKVYLANWYVLNRERVKEMHAKWRADNKSRVMKANAEWYKANIQDAKVKNAAWKAANPQARRIWAQNRRIRKRKFGGELSPDLPEKLYALQRGRCACCGASLENGYHLDHIVPLKLGGAHADRNMQLLTPACNMKKGAKTPEGFMREQGFLL